MSDAAAFRRKPPASAPRLQSRPTHEEGPAITRSSLLSRKTGIRAAAVATIVIAGTILGSQLKTRRQVEEKAQIQQAVAGDTSDHVSHDSNRSELPRNEPHLVPNAHAASASDLSKQISFLEEKRGALMMQKFNLEKKLAGVQERRKRVEEIDSHRK